MVLLKTAKMWEFSKNGNYDLELKCGTLTYQKGPDHTFMYYKNNGGRIDLSKDPLPTGVMFLTEDGRRQDIEKIVWPIIKHHYKDILGAEPCEDFKDKNRKAMLGALEKSLKIN